MDASRPYKVIKLPSAYGVCRGEGAEILYEEVSPVVADSLLYQHWLEDERPEKTLLYHIEVYKLEV